MQPRGRGRRGDSTWLRTGLPGNDSPRPLRLPWLLVFISYCRHGHKVAQKIRVFAVGRRGTRLQCGHFYLLCIGNPTSGSSQEEKFSTTLDKSSGWIVPYLSSSDNGRRLLFAYLPRVLQRFTAISSPCRSQQRSLAYFSRMCRCCVCFILHLCSAPLPALDRSWWGCYKLILVRRDWMEMNILVYVCVSMVHTSASIYPLMICYLVLITLTPFSAVRIHHMAPWMCSSGFTLSKVCRVHREKQTRPWLYSCFRDTEGAFPTRA